MTARARAASGRLAEAAAAQTLTALGYQILTRNYRCRRGEIDLIARHGSFIVFVEVKARRRGIPDSLEAVDARKRRRMVRAAMEYLAERRLLGAPVRFDVAAVLLDDLGRPMDVHVVQDAFWAGE
ncbi:MAG: YraN family protein [Bacillota bacterium]|nr:YraN family protein [Bacillota bacterium]REJ36927.1 MAG: YraN family protein [Bacillota bacterium]